MSVRSKCGFLWASTHIPMKMSTRHFYCYHSSLQFFFFFFTFHSFLVSSSPSFFFFFNINFFYLSADRKPLAAAIRSVKSGRATDSLTTVRVDGRMKLDFYFQSFISFIILLSSPSQFCQLIYLRGRSALVFTDKPGLRTPASFTGKPCCNSNI